MDLNQPRMFSQRPDLLSKDKKGCEEGTKHKAGPDTMKELIVKPIRFLQEAPHPSLRKTIKFEIKLDKVKPLETQVAGHGSKGQGHIGNGEIDETENHCGMLLHEEGFVLKPVQGPPKGKREIEFYQHISSSPHPVDLQFYNLVPKFYGTERLQDDSLSHKQYLILEDLTKGMSAPCVMDIKIGARTYGPDASQAKRTQEDSKYLGTKKPLGFSVLGIINRSEKVEGFHKLDKNFGLNLPTESVSDILNIFLNPGESPLNSKRVAAKFSQLLDRVADFFNAQSMYHVYASSLLFVYDFRCLQEMDLEETLLEKCVRVKMIDFAHVFPGDGQPDSNFILGLQNVQRLFHEFRNALGS